VGQQFKHHGDAAYGRDRNLIPTRTAKMIIEEGVVPFQSLFLINDSQRIHATCEARYLLLLSRVYVTLVSVLHEYSGGTVLKRNGSGDEWRKELQVRDLH